MKGYKIVKCHGVEPVISAMKKCDFHEEHPAQSPLERFVPQEEICNLQKSNVQRESWFLSEKYFGPFGDLVSKYFDLVRPIVESELSNLKIPYQKPPRWAMGVHSYSPDKTGEEGLHAHRDVDLLSVLASDGPLQGFVNGEWITIDIPKNHVMIFYGLSAWYSCQPNKFVEPPLLHRVPRQKDKPKFSVGAFVGPQLDEKFINTRNDVQLESVGQIDTVDDFYNAYFSGKLNWH